MSKKCDLFDMLTKISMLNLFEY